jgi:hypothetical protein
MPVEVQKFQVDEASLMYQARTSLADLANEIAAIRRLDAPETIVLIKRAAKIRYWLKALDYKEFLTLTQRNQIWWKLIELSGIYDFPTSPVLGLRTRPNILVGIQGPPGPTGPAGGSGGTLFENTDVDTGTETIDSFAFSTGTGATWEYTVRNAAGTASRTGTVRATILTDGSLVGSGTDISTAEIGDTSDVSLSVDISGSNVRLLATAASDNWIVEGSRTTIG